MRILLSLIGLLCVLAGGIWILQGVGILPGSFMTGQTRWTIYGCIAVVAGVTLFGYANRRRGDR